ncbi:MAG: hypothetical protein QOE55_878, partial [Acidobacteriaceae bacterium]|nr:hypothetical protein [Acidobacteriaceae bacterium]
MSGKAPQIARSFGPEPGGRRMWGFLVNQAALISVTQPGDLREDRVGQLIKRVLDGVA